MEELNKQKSLVESLKGQLSDKDQLINNREANNKNLLEDMEHLKVELEYVADGGKRCSLVH